MAEKKKAHNDGLGEHTLACRSSHDNVISVVCGSRLLVHACHHVVIEL